MPFLRKSRCFTPNKSYWSLLMNTLQCFVGFSSNIFFSWRIIFLYRIFFVLNYIFFRVGLIWHRQQQQQQNHTGRKSRGMLWYVFTQILGRGVKDVVKNVKGGPPFWTFIAFLLKSFLKSFLGDPVYEPIPI